MSSVDFLSVLVAEITARVTRVAWPVARDEALENTSSMQGETLLRALDASSDVERLDLPQKRIALRLRGGVRLLLTFVDAGNDLLGACSQSLWWAGLVRGSLHAVSRADLHLFIVAEAQGDSKTLLGDRNRIEADEQICRKHVWLPSIDGNAGDFLDTTFLAQPWGRDSLAPQSLDPLLQLVETAGLPPDVAGAWVKTLSSPGDLKGDDLANALIALCEDVNDG